MELVTPSIAQFMRDLEQVWDAHQQALIQRRDLQGALAQLAAEPAITHIPAMTGGTGRLAVERFYADQFLPYLPPDLTLRRISRTVDRWRLVDETTVSFTHDRELPWLLPGAEPTFRRAEVLAIAVVGFDRTRIRSQRMLWDHATLAGQLGLANHITAPAATGPAR
jgi:carboxymethylenebutenolidase